MLVLRNIKTIVKFHRKMPWLNSLAVQVTAFTVKQPARFGLGDGGG